MGIVDCSDDPSTTQAKFQDGSITLAITTWDAGQGNIGHQIHLNGA